MNNYRLFGAVCAVLFSFITVSANAELVSRLGGQAAYDTVLDITWTTNAGLSEPEHQFHQIKWAKDLNYLGFDDWRLPWMSVAASGRVDCSTATELACRDNEYGYMFYHNLGGVEWDDLTGTQTIGDVTLSNIQSDYWSGTFWQPPDSYPVGDLFGFDTGKIEPAPYHTCCFYGWAVRDGDVSPPPISVTIDIKPGNEHSVINPNTKGGIWVAVLSDTESDSPFDPSSQVDIPAVEFGPDGAKVNRYKVKDINNDGLGDLLLRFKIPETGIACGDTEATLTGKTFDDQSITGTDSVTTVGCPKENVIRIEALIDGRSQLVLRGNTAQWHHLDFAAPGRHEFRNEPTTLNDAIWFPVWPDDPDEENYFCDCFSDVFKPVKPTQPRKDVSVDLNLIQSRGETEIVQYPSKDNDYTLILDFNDNPIGSSDNYIVEVHFSEASLKPEKRSTHKLSHPENDHNKRNKKHYMEAA